MSSESEQSEADPAIVRRINWSEPMIDPATVEPVESEMVSMARINEIIRRMIQPAFNAAYPRPGDWYGLPHHEHQAVIRHPDHDGYQWRQESTQDVCAWRENYMTDDGTDESKDIISNIDEALREYDAEVLEQERAQAERIARLSSRKGSAAD